MRLIYTSDKIATLKDKYGHELVLSKGRNFTANQYAYIVDEKYNIGKANFEKLLTRCEVKKSKRDDYYDLIDKLNHIESVISKEIGKSVYITDTGVDAENATEGNDAPFNWKKAEADDNYIGWDSMYNCAMDAAANRIYELQNESGDRLNPNDYGISW